MSDFKTLRSRRDVTFSSTSDPTVNTVAEVRDTYQNITSGELFTCHNIVSGIFTEWIGTQGTSIVFDSAITSPNHSDLLLMYTMDNAQGSTLFDETANNRDATTANISYIGGKIGASIDMTGGAGSGVTLDAQLTSSSNDWSCSFWINIDSFAGYNAYITSIQSGLSNFGLPASSEAKNTWSLFNSSLHPLPKTLTTGVWYHFVVNVVSGTATAYLDTLESSQSRLGIPAADIRYLGINSAGGNALNAQMDQFRVFDRSLTLDEISTLYNEGYNFILDNTNPNLVSHYTMDSVNGTAIADESPNGNVGTTHGTVSYEPAVFGNGIYLSNTTNGIDLPYVIDVTQPFSYSAWVHLTGESQNRLFESFVDANNWWTVEVADNIVSHKYRFDGGAIVDVWNNVATGGALVLDNHMLLTFTYDGTNARFYVDKALVAGPTAVSYPASKWQSDWAVGFASTHSSASHNMTLDGVRIFNRALDITEVGAIYDESQTIPTVLPSSHVDIVAHYTLGDGANAGIDSSSNAYNGTVTGATTEVGVIGNQTRFVNPTTSSAPSQWINTPTVTATGDFTISFWVDVTGMDGTAAQSVVSHYDSVTAANRRRLSYHKGTGVLRTTVGSTGYPSFSPNPIPSTGHVHCVVIRRRGGFEYYVDTENVGQNGTSTNSSDFYFDFIGAWDDVTVVQGHLDAGLDDLRVYDRAINRFEVQELFDAGV